MIKAEVERFFGDDSPLKNGGGTDGFKYEPRRQQVDMALAVADAMDAQENLCVEAPTGVGKTFAHDYKSYDRMNLGVPSVAI